MSTEPSIGAPLREWREHPAKFVRDVFGVEPDAWQEEVLEAFPRNPRIAMSCGKGPGKSTVLAWMAWNFLLTRPHPKIAATSVSEKNLRDGLWTEMAKWQARSPMLSALFDYQKERITNKEHPEQWWMSARTWSKSADTNTQSATLAGLHAEYILFLLDESGGIPDAVAVAAEAALSSCVEGHIVQAGNPIMRAGPLYRACVSDRSSWHVTEVTGDPDDPKRSPRVDAEWARDQIRRYGRDNPFVLTNVFGKFPPSSITGLISADEVMEAMKRSYGERDIVHAARILGVDVARYGDDSSVIFPRQGLVAFSPSQYRGLDTQTGAGIVARKMVEWQPHAVFIDEGGGYGAGWIDTLRSLGHSVIGVHFAGRPFDMRFFNKRAEMYWTACEWIKNGGQLPDTPELIAELSEAQYTYRGDRLLLEDKDQIKSRLGRSPDFADAFVETFAQPVSSRESRRRSRILTDYDPFEDVFKTPAVPR